ncbi:aspartate aminotransferase family protein [Amycolatopsis sp. AA4]|uniref:aspartate aminotransferase family protein n=1 Tax=Actinomycetes TaxID=1760 RepID=UPI0001B54B69|nr:MULTISPECIES: aminotransferase class III-fold pyridoxal phosphate-dependent enzyme [Actinomycetes]ATY13515.1 aspartate aminotransferase family protein [Amycolatopsis sp. AA4]EFL09472.1 glutamate-1-semialdehyde-2,1-aminomutase [Streptomyces sp. AA4]
MLDDALEAAYARYALKRPESARLHAGAAAYLPSGTTRSVLDFAPFPFAVASATGCRLTDVDGHEYLDYLGDYSVGLAGHNPAEVREAIETVLAGGWSFGAVAPEEAQVARLLCERYPSMDLVRFTSSGTEANLVAVSLAAKASGHAAVLAFDGGYHGGFLSFSRDGESLNVPFESVVCDYNDLESVATAFESRQGRFACVLVEPMLGSGGRIPGDPAFLRGVRNLCDEYGVPLVFDEVQTSRTALGGAQAVLGITPDLTTAGKYLGGGFGFGVVGGRNGIMRMLDRANEPHFDHSGTFNNNRFSMAAALAMLNEVLTAERLDELFHRGERLRKQANELLRTKGFQATGWGSLISIHPVDRAVSRAADLAGADRRRVRLLFHELIERGVYIGKSGFVTLSLAQDDLTDETFLTALEGALSAHDDYGRIS